MSMSARVAKIQEELQQTQLELRVAKEELQGLLDSLDDHITQDEIYSAIKTIKESL